jgi:ATP-binding cassette subfamily B (MDR/TAP) protein 1
LYVPKINPCLAATEQRAQHYLTRFKQRIFRYTDRWDRILYLIAAICSIGTGASLPLMTLIFGRFTTVFTDYAVGAATPDQFTAVVNQLALYFVYLAVARFAIIYIGTLSVNIAAIRTVRRLRGAFLEHTLRQEVWHFDQQTNGSTATQVTTSKRNLAARLSYVLTASRWKPYQPGHC